MILFDELEKAHPDVFNTLLQVLEDGHLTDGQGRTVDFRNTVIILTTNLGTRDATKAVSMGFDAGGAADRNERMRRAVTDALQHLRPEFLNRIDETIVFHALDRDHVLHIVDRMVARVADQLADKGIALRLTDAGRDWLAGRGFDPALGARPLRRTIQREVEDALAERILFQELQPGRQSSSTLMATPATRRRPSSSDRYPMWTGGMPSPREPSGECASWPGSTSSSSGARRALVLASSNFTPYDTGGPDGPQWTVTIVPSRPRPPRAARIRVPGAWPSSATTSSASRI